MSGALAAAALVIAAMREQIVDALAVLEQQLGPLPDGALAEPRLLTTSPTPPELVALTDWPFVSAGPARTLKLTLTDRRPDADVYLASYELRLLAWATGPGYAETVAGRDRLVTALLRVLLTEGAMGGLAAVLRETITVDWSPTGLDEDLEALVSAAAVSFTVGVEELHPIVPGPVDSAPAGWSAEVDGRAAWPGDTLELPGGPPPEGSV